MSEFGPGADSMETNETGGTETAGFDETGAAQNGTEIGNVMEAGDVVPASEINSDEKVNETPFNQIIETPEKTELEMAEEQVEKVYEETSATLLENYGAYISKENMERVENGIDDIRVTENMERGKTGGYLYHDGKSSMTIASISEAQRERSTIHETLHFHSNHKEIYVPMPEKDGYMVYNTVGTRQSSWFHSAKTGENSGYSEKGRGMNEGITTVKTIEHLNSIDPEKGEEAEHNHVYEHAKEIITSLQEIVGKEAINEFYFGGSNHKLETKVNELVGDEYEHLIDCLDRSIDKDSYAVRVEATKEAHQIISHMSERMEK